MLQQFIEKVTDGIDRGKYKCGICGKINGQKIHTQNHIESIHFPGTFEYNCKHCSLTFTGRNKLYIHVNQVHKGLKYWTCLCDIMLMWKWFPLSRTYLIKPIFLLLGQFADPSDLFQFVVETFDGGKRFHCGLCNKFAHSGKTHVRNHVESVHYPNSFLYPCDQCEKSFPSKQNFQLHRSRVHKHKNAPV